MRRILLLTLWAGALATFAACGGGSEPGSGTQSPTATQSAVTATPTNAAGQSITPVAFPVTSTAAATVTSPTAASETPAVASATSAPATNTVAAPPPTQATQPTPTPPPASSNNPLSASVGVAGSSRFFWAPSSVAIAPGGTVTWSWNEPVQPHNVAGENFPLGPTAIGKSGNASYTFTAPGTYAFYCETHPDTMRGTVTVQ